MPKSLSEFQNEDEEREFWASEDSTKYLDWGAGEARHIPKLKPSTKIISLRLSEVMLNEIKIGLTQDAFEPQER
jgi:hypothetical protein